MNLNRETKLAGILLILQVLLMVATIIAEKQIGWLEAQQNREVADAVPMYMLGNWPALSKVWGFQMLAYFSGALACLLFLKNARMVKGVPLSIFWAVVLLGNIMVIIGFGITLGGYFESLQVYDSQPFFFKTIRSIVLSVYGKGLQFGIALWGVFILEGFTKQGLMPVFWAWVVAGIVMLAMFLSALDVIPGILVMAVGYVIPLSLGVSYIRYTKQ